MNYVGRKVLNVDNSAVMQDARFGWKGGRIRAIKQSNYNL